MSFDILLCQFVHYSLLRLNPFGTGQCLSTEWAANSASFKGLNPFGTGQCLSTNGESFIKLSGLVSIPLEQGNVFRQIW